MNMNARAQGGRVGKGMLKSQGKMWNALREQKGAYDDKKRLGRKDSREGQRQRERYKVK